MEFYKKAKAQMKELQDDFGELKTDFRDLRNAQSHSSPPSAASNPSAPTGSSYGGTPAASDYSRSSGSPSSETPTGSSARTPATSSAAATSHSTAMLSVKPNDAPGAPGPRLPLTARKSVRDDFESKKDELVAKLSSIMATPWILHVDVCSVYSYAIEERTQARDNPGRMLYNYFDYAVRNVETFVKKYSDDGRNQLNKLASSHIMTLEPALNNEIRNTSKNPSFCDINGGKLRILFGKDKLGLNPTTAVNDIAEVVSAAGAAGEAESGAGYPVLSLAARNSVETVYEPQIASLLQEVRSILSAPTLEFVPNFESNFAAVKLYVEKHGDRNIGGDWDKKFGNATLEYFKGLKVQLERQKFAGDEMLQEGFGDAVERNEVQLRVVDKLPNSKKRYNDCAIEGGVLYLLVVAEWWKTNVNDTTQGLLNLL